MTRALTARAAALALLASPLLVLTATAPADAAVTVFPVPTSAAGLGRITTAPDGSMWFAEEDANKVGRITTAGQVQEFALPPTDSSVEGPVQSLDVGPDGSVWVVTEHGEDVVRLSSTGQLLDSWTFENYDGCVGDTCPYGGEVRVDPAGKAWVTMNYGSSFIAVVTPTGGPIAYNNSPECDDVLGEAADGSMWCQNGSPQAQDTITHVGADAASGTTYPLPSDASYPNALAAGPVGSIWFTRSWTGTFATSPSHGSVGYLDAATGATQIWGTGSRSAPQDLVKGPDNQMWFTNAGAVPGIGHVSATGVGAVSSVGNYQPTSLTFGPDGAIWFTDATNNAIVRVTTDQLQTTNVDLGDGVTIVPPTVPTPPPAPVPAAVVGTIAKVKGVTSVRRGKVAVPVTCPEGAATGCRGVVGLELAKGGKSLGEGKAYVVRAGKKAKVKVALSKKGLKRLRPGKVVKVRVELTAKGSSKVLAKRTIRVRRS
ncbi:Vgb family protein [Nocardioides zeicaulis]|uniref:ScyD/ScyE family protein n=1 Tax=Nocardioides zeicaulis TaxID=1776857 RepID=A0ABV6E2J7_9ACTN